MSLSIHAPNDVLDELSSFLKSQSIPTTEHGKVSKWKICDSGKVLL